MHSQLADRYETLFTSWLKKVDAKSTIKKRCHSFPEFLHLI